MTAIAHDRICNDSTKLDTGYLTNTESSYCTVKRAIDVFLAGSLLVVLAPVLILVAGAIAAESKGGILFHQQRIGKNGQPFRFWKFRSMRTDAEDTKMKLMDKNEMQGGVLFKMKQDPRETMVGRFIRKYSLDELPQLWNVIIGDMSLVGPRPALPDEVATYTPSQRERLKATPGITCTWQVSGRSNIPFEQQVMMDKDYIANCSLMVDLGILIRTVPAVVLGTGAF